MRGSGPAHPHPDPPAPGTSGPSRGRPRLSSVNLMKICEDIFLLVTTAKGWPEGGDTPVLNAAVLADLAEAGRIAATGEDGELLTVTSAEPTGHPVLDLVLESVAAKNGAPIAEALAEPQRLRYAVGDELARRGVVSKLDRRWRDTAYPEADSFAEDQLRDRLARVLHQETTASAQEAEVLGLLRAAETPAANLAPGVRGDGKRAANHLLDAFADASPWARALQKAISEDDDDTALTLAMFSTINLT